MDNVHVVAMRIVKKQLTWFPHMAAYVTPWIPSWIQSTRATVKASCNMTGVEQASSGGQTRTWVSVYIYMEKYLYIYIYIIMYRQEKLRSIARLSWVCVDLPWLRIWAGLRL